MTLQRCCSRRSGCAPPGCPQPCWPGSPVPAHPGGPARVGPGRPAGHGGASSEFPGVTAQVQPVIQLPAAVRRRPRPRCSGYLQPITPQEVAQRHLPVTGFSGVDLVGQAGLEDQYDQPAARHGRDPGGVGQRGRRRHRRPSARPRPAPATTWSPASTPRSRLDTQNALDRPSPGAGRGQHRRNQRRGGGDDHHRPGRRHGQLPRPTTPASGPAASPAGVQRPVRHQRTGSRSSTGPPRASTAPGSTWKVTSTAAARRGRLPAGRPVRLPRLGDDRRPDLQQRRRAEPR